MLKQHRFATLDGLRGVAALIVLVFHLAQQMHGSNSLPFAPLAVDFFYVLSGFVVAFAYESKLSSGKMSVPAFAVVRAKRLYPLLLLGNAMGIGLAILSVATKHTVTYRQVAEAATLNLLLLPSYVFPQWATAFPFNMAAWSLTFEAFVNAVYALLAKKLSPARLITLTAASSLMLVWLVIRNNGVAGGMDQNGFAYGFVRVLYPFFVGVLLCRYRARQREASIVATVLFLGLILALISPGPRSPITGLVHVLILFPLIVGLGAAVSVGPKLSEVCRRLGELSYPIYILQAPIIRLGAEMLKHKALKAPETWLFAATEAAVVGAVAWTALRFYDDRLRRSLRSASAGTSLAMAETRTI